MNTLWQTLHCSDLSAAPDPATTAVAVAAVLWRGAASATATVDLAESMVTAASSTTGVLVNTGKSGLHTTRLIVDDAIVVWSAPPPIACCWYKEPVVAVATAAGFNGLNVQSMPTRTKSSVVDPPPAEELSIGISPLISSTMSGTWPNTFSVDKTKSNHYNII